MIRSFGVLSLWQNIGGSPGNHGAGAAGGGRVTRILSNLQPLAPFCFEIPDKTPSGDLYLKNENLRYEIHCSARLSSFMTWINFCSWSLVVWDKVVYLKFPLCFVSTLCHKLLDSFCCARNANLRFVFKFVHLQIDRVLSKMSTRCQTAFSGFQKAVKLGLGASKCTALRSYICLELSARSI